MQSQRAGIKISKEDGSPVCEFVAVDGVPISYNLGNYDGVFDFFGPSAAQSDWVRFHNSYSVTLNQPIQGPIRVQRVSYYDWSSSSGNAAFSVSTVVGGTIYFE